MVYNLDPNPEIGFFEFVPIRISAIITGFKSRSEHGIF
jgi:hypothetical protein